MPTPLDNCLQAIDAINQQDPACINHDGQDIAKALLYGQRMSGCLRKYFADASDLLQIAVRAQHLQRWAIGRDEYEQNRVGYLRWRKALAAHHAKLCSQLMQTEGFAEEQCKIVSGLLQKQGIKTNAETQTLEDVACLVFLEYYFDDFAAKHSQAKIISIVQKTWAKMSAEAQQLALQLPLSEAGGKLIGQALEA